MTWEQVGSSNLRAAGENETKFFNKSEAPKKLNSITARLLDYKCTVTLTSNTYDETEIKHFFQYDGAPDLDVTTENDDTVRATCSIIYQDEAAIEIFLAKLFELAKLESDTSIRNKIREALDIGPEHPAQKEILEVLTAYQSDEFDKALRIAIEKTRRGDEGILEKLGFACINSLDFANICRVAIVSINPILRTEAAMLIHSKTVSAFPEEDDAVEREIATLETIFRLLAKPHRTHDEKPLKLLCQVLAKFFGTEFDPSLINESALDVETVLTLARMLRKSKNAQPSAAVDTMTRPSSPLAMGTFTGRNQNKRRQDEGDESPVAKRRLTDPAQR